MSFMCWTQITLDGGRAGGESPGFHQHKHSSHDMVGPSEMGKSRYLIASHETSGLFPGLLSLNRLLIVIS